jgi:hypothetical protein
VTYRATPRPLQPPGSTSPLGRNGRRQQQHADVGDAHRPILPILRRSTGRCTVLVASSPAHRDGRAAASSAAHRVLIDSHAPRGRMTRLSSRVPTSSPQSRHASSTQAWRGTRGSATASRSYIDERVGGTPSKYAEAGSAPGCSSLVRPRRHRLPHADRRGNHLGLLRSGPTAAFVRVGQAMRTIEVTSVAPRA